VKGTKSEESHKLVKIEVPPDQQLVIARSQIDKRRKEIGEIRRSRKEAALKSKTSLVGIRRADSPKKVGLGELRDAVKASLEQYEACKADMEWFGIAAASLLWYKLCEARLALLAAEIELFGRNLNAHIEKISAMAKAEEDELKKANLESHEAAWRVVSMDLRAILERVKAGGPRAEGGAR